MFKQVIENTLKMAQKALREEMERNNFNMVLKIQSQILDLEMQLSIID